MKRIIFSSCKIFLGPLTVLLTVLSVRAMPVIVHQAPLEAKEKQSLVINATVTDPVTSITQVKLYYRIAGTLGYKELIMQGTGYNYTAHIPGKMVTAAGIDYYIQVRNQANEIATSPPLNAASAPHRVIVRETIAAPQLTLLSPEDGAIISPLDAVLVILIDAGKSKVDLSSLKVILDEKDITSQVEKSETMISYVAPENLAPGLHGLQVSVRNVDGMEARSPTWSFEVSRKKQVPSWQAEMKKEQEKPSFKFRGNLNTEFQYTVLSKTPADTLYLYQPEGWLNRLHLNFSGKAGEFNLLGTAYVTSEEAPGRQPVDRFRMDMVSPRFNFSVGDIYPVFTDFTIYNSFVRGGYLRWLMGDHNQAHSEFYAVGGINQIAVAGYTAPQGSGESDSAGTFERWMGGIRWLSDFTPGTGFSINGSAVMDNSSSLAEEKRGGIYPYYNFASTAEGHIKINYTPSFFSLFFGEYGLGIYYEEDNFLTTALGDALRGGTRWEWGDYHSFLSVEYKQIGANYVTLANPWLIGDSQGLYCDGQLHFLDNNLIIMGDVDICQDNLDGQKNYDIWNDATNNSITVTATTKTTYISGMLSYRLLPYLTNLSVGYSVNYQKDQATPVSIIDNQTGILSLGAGSQIPLGTDQMLVNFSYVVTNYKDLAEARLSGDIETSSFLASLMYLRNIWSVAVGYGLSRNFTDESGMGSLSSLLLTYGHDKQTIDYVFLNFRANWKAVPGKLNVGCSLENLRGKDDISEIDNNLFTMGANSTYYFSSAHSITFSISQVKYGDNLNDGNSYDELVINLRYALGF